MKTLKQFLGESADSHKEVEDFMHHVYKGAHPDLPKHGNYHHSVAIGHLSDTAYDHFGPKHPARSHLRNIAKNVVSAYSDDDTGESRDNDRKREKAWAKRSAPPKAPKEPKAPKVKRWDERPPRNKGVGSF